MKLSNSKCKSQSNPENDNLMKVPVVRLKRVDYNSKQKGSLVWAKYRNKLGNKFYPGNIF